MSENQRDNIVQCAATMMHAAGVKSVSIDDISRELGISKKTFYHYFETKDLLVEELLHCQEEKIREDIHRTMAGKKVIDLAMNFMKVINTPRDVRKVPPLLYDLQKYYPQHLRNHLERLRIIGNELAEQFLLRGVEQGFFRADINVQAMARVLSGLHSLMLTYLVQNPNNPTLVSDSKMALDVFFRGMVSDEGKRQIEERLVKK